MKSKFSLEKIVSLMHIFLHKYCSKGDVTNIYNLGSCNVLVARDKNGYPREGNEIKKGNDMYISVLMLARFYHIFDVKH